MFSTRSCFSKHLLHSRRFIAASWNSVRLAHCRTLECHRPASAGLQRSCCRKTRLGAYRSLEADRPTLTPCRIRTDTPAERMPGASGEGGTFVGSRGELVEKASQSYITVNACGRALISSKFAFHWTHFAVVHIDPSQSLRQRFGLLSRIGPFLARVGERSVELGVWKLVLSGEGRRQEGVARRHNPARPRVPLPPSQACRSPGRWGQPGVNWLPCALALFDAR